MKKILLLLPVIAFATAAPVKAQLFQKLKDKVNNTINGGNKSTASSSKATTGASSSSNNNAPVIDFGKYNINNQVAYVPGGVQANMFQLQLEKSIYKVKGDAVTADIVCYATNRKVGEASDFAGSDIAYVYEDGKLLATKSVGDIINDKSIEVEYTRHDWPYNFTGQITEFFPDGNPTHFTFNGKSFSNYLMIMPIVISKDKTKFYAIGGENDNNGITYYLFTANKRVALPSNTAFLMYNPDFTICGAYGFSNRLEAEREKTGNALQAASNIINEGDVYFSDGTIRKNASNTAQAWLDPTGKNILRADRQAGNFVNGKQVSTEGAAEGNLWCGPDGTKWAYYLGNITDTQPAHLKFSDGADIPNAVHPQQWTVNGKSYMVWLQYRAMYTGDLLVCTKEL